MGGDIWNREHNRCTIYNDQLPLDRTIEQSTNSVLDLKYQLVVSHRERVMEKVCKLNWYNLHSKTVEWWFNPRPPWPPSPLLPWKTLQSLHVLETVQRWLWWHLFHLNFSCWYLPHLKLYFINLGAQCKSLKSTFNKQTLRSWIGSRITWDTWEYHFWTPRFLEI